MKKEFTPGMYCKFPNEEIPHILNILRANGWAVSENIILDDDCLIGVNINRLLYANASPTIGLTTELSRHDFMCIALRLEEGVGVCGSPEQKKHIIETVKLLGMNVSEYFKEDFQYYDVGLINDRWYTILTNIKLIDYLDLCKRLCVEPIGELKDETPPYKEGDKVQFLIDGKEGIVKSCWNAIGGWRILVSVFECCDRDFLSTRVKPIENEPTAEPVFDPSKPFEVSDDCVEWKSIKSPEYIMHYIGIDRNGQHVIETELGIARWNHIRNIQEFNASMLNRGECMIIDDIENIQWKGFILAKTDEGNFYCMEGDKFHKGVLFGEGHKIKGRRVDVEIKVVETKTTKS